MVEAAVAGADVVGATDAVGVAVVGATVLVVSAVVVGEAEVLDDPVPEVGRPAAGLAAAIPLHSSDESFGPRTA